MTLEVLNDHIEYITNISSKYTAPVKIRGTNDNDYLFGHFEYNPIGKNHIPYLEVAHGTIIDPSEVKTPSERFLVHDAESFRKFYKLAESLNATTFPCYESINGFCTQVVGLDLKVKIRNNVIEPLINIRSAIVSKYSINEVKSDAERKEK